MPTKIMQNICENTCKKPNTFVNYLHRSQNEDISIWSQVARFSPAQKLRESNNKKKKKKIIKRTQQQRKEKEIFLSKIILNGVGE